MTSGQAIISIAVVFIGVDTVVLSADPRWCTETLIESPEGRRDDVVYYKPVDGARWVALTHTTLGTERWK